MWLVVLMAGLGCVATESGEPLRAAAPAAGKDVAAEPSTAEEAGPVSPAGTQAGVEPAVDPEAGGAPPAAPGFVSPGRDPVDGFSVFPAFMPPVSFGTETQDCRLGTDPYSTCI